ncbi:MAG: hypothetical protein MUO77_20635 [Anaerolineales bacterium]|nr:hypothetical protein [Anaerolineales bacterium]
MPSHLEMLTQINLDDLVSSFGWEHRPFFTRLLRRLFFKPAQAFAQQMTLVRQVSGHLLNDGAEKEYSKIKILLRRFS